MAGALVLGAASAQAGRATIAVAANFAEPVEILTPLFEDTTGHELELVVGSTGKLYAQISHGAPFDVLLAADDERPRRLAEESLADPSSRFTYALGRLALWSPDPGRIEDGPATLRAGDFRFLAIANPALAPYGAAAQATLEKLGLREVLADKIVQGESIGQAFAMVASGNAELGFVALSYVVSERNPAPGSRWDVPPEYHEPIRQDAVLLAHGQNNMAARAFLDFLQSPQAREVIARFGYGLAGA